jgi:general stress protein YciG
MAESNNEKWKNGRGFAGMSPEKRIEMARKGGKAAAVPRANAYCSFRG